MAARLRALPTEDSDPLRKISRAKCRRNFVQEQTSEPRIDANNKRKTVTTQHPAKVAVIELG